MSVLFKNATILVEKKIIKNAFLSVENTTIKNISEKAIDGNFDTVIDMTGKLLMPGLVNAHGHAPMTLLRDVGTGLPLDRWLNEAIFPIEDKMKPEHIQIGSQMAMLEMLASGTTMFSEMYDFPWAEAEVIEKAGMKSNLDRVGLWFPPNRLNECIEFARDYKDPTDKVRSEFCIHSEYLTNDEFVSGISKANQTIKKPVNIHVSETKKEHEECLKRHGCTPVAYFEKMGILDNPTYMAHCVWVTDEDLSIMKKHNVSLVHNPTSNMKLGSGFARIKNAFDMGINVCIGTDGCASNDNLNMFEEIHIASLLQNGLNLDSTALSCYDVIDMATINGAKAMNRYDTGILKVGKKADIIAIDLNKPHLIPNNNIPALISYSMQGSDVCMTMVDGKILYKDGEYFTLDKEKIIYEFKKTAEILCK